MCILSIASILESNKHINSDNERDKKQDWDGYDTYYQNPSHLEADDQIYVYDWVFYACCKQNWNLSVSYTVSVVVKILI